MAQTKSTKRRTPVRRTTTEPTHDDIARRAFELYLDAHPEMHRRVALLALLDPSRQDIPEYAEYVGAIQREAVNEIQTGDVSVTSREQRT